MIVPLVLAGLSALTGSIQEPLNPDQRALIELAHRAVESEISGKNLDFAKTNPSQPVFVTIECHGAVRGCRGDLRPRARTLEEEIVTSARSAADHDPRYKPLSPAEARDCQITITLVSSEHSVTDVRQLQPKDGLVLRSGDRVGIVLPWEGKDPETRLDWAYRKAHVTKGSAVSLEILEAERFRG